MKNYFLNVETASQESDKCSALFWVSVASIVLFAFLGISSRSALYYDEILNTFKGNSGVIFDYALRPVYYGLNWLALRLFGPRPESLILLACFIFIAQSILVLCLAKRAGGYWTLPFIVAGLFLLGDTFAYGIQGMPNIFVGLVACILIFLLHKLDERYFYSPSSRHLHWVIVLGLFAGFFMLLHPSTISFVFATGVTICWISLVRTKVNLGVKHRLSKAAITGATYAVFVVLALCIADVLYRVVADQSYFGTYLGGLQKLKATRYESYVQPFSYYFSLSWTWYGVLLIPLIIGFCVHALTLVLSVLSTQGGIRGESKEDCHGKSYTRLSGNIVVFLFSALLCMSMSEWKFPRVLVSFGPVFMLAAWFMWRDGTLAVSRAPQIFRISYHGGWLLVLSIVFFSKPGVDPLQRYPLNEQHNREVFRRFYSPTSYIQSTDERSFLFVGTRAGQRGSFVSMAAVGRDLHPVSWNAFRSAKNPAAHLRSALSEVQSKHIVVVWPIEDPEIPRLVRSMAKAGFRKIWDNGFVEIWKFDNCPSIFLVNAHLQTFPPKSRVALWGMPEVESLSLQNSLRSIGLLPYALSERASPRTVASKLENNHVSAVLMPTTKTEQFSQFSNNYSEVVSSRVCRDDHTVYSLRKRK